MDTKHVFKNWSSDDDEKEEGEEHKKRLEIFNKECGLPLDSVPFYHGKVRRELTDFQRLVYDTCDKLAILDDSLNKASDMVHDYYLERKLKQEFENRQNQIANLYNIIPTSKDDVQRMYNDNLQLAIRRQAKCSQARVDLAEKTKSINRFEKARESEAIGEQLSMLCLLYAPALMNYTKGKLIASMILTWGLSTEKMFNKDTRPEQQQLVRRIYDECKKLLPVDYRS